MRIAICDDDAVFADKLRILAKDGFAALHIEPDIAVYSDGADFLEDRQECDVVFLDIDMPVKGMASMNGFDIAGRVGEETLIVFVTMHDELVYSSMKFRPFRFIRKSHLSDELPEVLDALNRTVSKRRVGQKFEFQTKTGTVFLDVGSITYIEIYGHWFRVQVDGGANPECYGSLSELEKQLAPFDFIRTHKSYLVNCRYIYAIEKRKIILDDKTEIPLSRYRAEEVKEKFRRFIIRGECEKY